MQLIAFCQNTTKLLENSSNLILATNVIQIKKGKKNKKIMILKDPILIYYFREVTITTIIMVFF